MIFLIFAYGPKLFAFPFPIWHFINNSIDKSFICNANENENENLIKLLN